MDFCLTNWLPKLCIISLGVVLGLHYAPLPLYSQVRESTAPLHRKRGLATTSVSSDYCMTRLLHPLYKCYRHKDCDIGFKPSFIFLKIISAKAGFYIHPDINHVWGSSFIAEDLSSLVSFPFRRKNVLEHCLCCGFGSNNFCFFYLKMLLHFYSSKIYSLAIEFWDHRFSFPPAL